MSNLRPETHAELLAAMLRIEALLPGGHVPGVRDLVERARYDLEQGWNEAAIDCIDRAERLLSDPTEERRP